MTLEEQLQMATGTTTITNANDNQGQIGTTTVNTQSEAQVVQPTTTTTVQQPVATQQPVQMASVEELHQATPQIDINNGVQTIQLGQEVNTKPINLLRKLGVGEKVRFTVIPGDRYQIRYHYTEERGKFACFSVDGQQPARCCLENGNYKTKFTIPILVYPTMPNDPKTVIPNAKADFRILALWDAQTYRVIDEALIRNGNNPVDFVATATDTYGRLDIREEVGVSYANQFSQNIQEAINTFNAYKSMVPTLIRKNMDETTYLNASRISNQVNNNSANYNYNNRGGYQNYNNIY